MDEITLSGDVVQEVAHAKPGSTHVLEITAELVGLSREDPEPWKWRANFRVHKVFYRSVTMGKVIDDVLKEEGMVVVGNRVEPAPG